MVRMMRLCILPVAIWLSALIFASAAAADVVCGNTGGTICCGSQVWLPIRHVAVSYWSGDAGKSYYARRRDSTGKLTYDYFKSTGGNWSFDNGVDAYRGTGIYRDGSTLMNFAMSQVSHTYC
jgi:hypothetical protein